MIDNNTKIKQKTMETKVKEVKGFNNYLISKNGEVIDKTTPQEVKLIRLGGSAKHKYYQGVNLKDSEGVQKKKYVHRLVAEAFIPNPNNYTDVRLKDGNPLNCSVENLEWITRSESMLKANEEGRVAKTRFQTPLDVVFKIRYESEVCGESANRLAVKYNRATTSVKKIIRYITFNTPEILEMQEKVFTNL